MKKCLVILVVLQLLVNSMLGYAHLELDPHDAWDSAHAHMVEHQADALSQDNELENHETEVHAHFCFVVLDNSGPITNAAMSSKPVSLVVAFSSHIASPPVPPPNA